MMSNKAVAVSVINNFMGDVNPGFAAIDDLEFSDRKLPLMRGSETVVDFHGRTKDGRHFIIEMQPAESSSFNPSVVFQAASTFARERLSGGESGGDGIKKVYAIQFLNGYFRNGGAGSEPYFRVRDESCEGAACEIHLIQIELDRIDMNFPVAPKVALCWPPVKWWYYAFKFLETFPEAEIRRCQRYLMPADVSLGLTQLQQQFWGKKKDLGDEYRFAEGLAKARLEGEIEGESRVELFGLMAIFLTNGSLDGYDVQLLTEGVSESFVRKTWDLYNNPRKTESRYEPFLKALWRYGAITD
jgi:hypothetical protein